MHPMHKDSAFELVQQLLYISRQMQGLDDPIFHQDLYQYFNATIHVIHALDSRYLFSLIILSKRWMTICRSVAAAVLLITGVFESCSLKQSKSA